MSHLVGHAVGLPNVEGSVDGFVFRKDPYVGYVSSVGSLPFVCVVAGSLECCWVF